MRAGLIIPAVVLAVLWAPSFARAQETPGAIENQRIDGRDEGPGSDEDTFGGLFRTLAALGIVVVAIFGARWLILRYGRQGGVGGTHAGPMQVLARAGIDHRQQLLLVRLGERLLLVGSASGSLSTLSEITDAEEVDRLTRQARKRGGFGALLRKKESEMNDASERQSPDVERLKRRLNGATRDHERET